MRGLTLIGEGSSRKVYSSDGFPFVIKQSKDDGRSNRKEVEFWEAISGTEHAGYFVPVVWADASYEVIIMLFASPVDRVEPKRLKVPLQYSMHNGLTAKDFGMIGGCARCFDYQSCVTDV